MVEGREGRREGEGGRTCSEHAVPSSCGGRGCGRGQGGGGLGDISPEVCRPEPQTSVESYLGGRGGGGRGGGRDTQLPEWTRRVWLTCVSGCG